MGVVKSLDNEINQYLHYLNTDQKKVVLNLVKAFAKLQYTEPIWKDKSFVKEMNSQVEEFESGKDKGLGWEEVKISAKRKNTNKKEGSWKTK